MVASPQPEELLPGEEMPLYRLPAEPAPTGKSLVLGNELEASLSVVNGERERQGLPKPFDC